MFIPEVGNKTCAHLDSIFSNPPFLKPSTDIADDKGVIELNIGSLSLTLIFLLCHFLPPSLTVLPIRFR